MERLPAWFLKKEEEYVTLRDRLVDGEQSVIDRSKIDVLCTIRRTGKLDVLLTLLMKTDYDNKKIHTLNSIPCERAVNGNDKQFTRIIRDFADLTFEWVDSEYDEKKYNHIYYHIEYKEDRYKCTIGLFNLTDAAQRINHLAFRGLNEEEVNKWNAFRRNYFTKTETDEEELNIWSNRTQLHLFFC